MSKKKTIYIAALLIPIILNTLASNSANTPKLQTGYFDLSAYDFSKKEKVALTGEWEFYWAQLLKPSDFDAFKNRRSESSIIIPSLWNSRDQNGGDYDNIGYATYRAHLIFSNTSDILAMKISRLYSSYKVWIDGKLMVEAGKVGATKKNTIHRRIASIIPFMPDSKNPTEIIIQVANFYHKNGGMNNPPVIGEMQTILQENNSRKSSDAMLWGSLIFIGLAFLFLYSLWQKDKAILYFSLFCLFWAYRNMSDVNAPLVNLFPFISWEFNAKIEYIALYLGSFTGSLYFNTIFKKRAHPKYQIILSWLSVIFAAMTLFSPDSIFTYYLFPFFVAMLINLIYIGVIVIRSIADKNRSSIFAITSILVGIIVFSAHLVIFCIDEDVSSLYINIGYLSVFLLSAMLLGFRFSRAFFKLAVLQVQTHEQKEELQTQADLLRSVNDQINNQKLLLEERNEEIRAINGDLEMKVNERTVKLKKTNKELDLFLYRASHDLRRPISTILGIDKIASLSVKETGAQDLFKKVEITAKGMDKMLKKIIAISEINNHEINFKPIHENDIHKTVSSQATYFSSIYPIAEYEIQLDIPPKIHSDMFIINKITTYLIENSFMFFSKKSGEKLCIQIKIIENGSQLKMILSDNGTGIKKKVLNKIFKMYFVGNAKSGGNGLGLHIVKKAVNKLEGKIFVESEFQRGSTFHITLNKYNATG